MRPPTIEVHGDTIVIRDLHAQIFTWRDETTGRLLHFDVAALQRHVLECPDDAECLEADMDPTFVEGTILAKGWADVARARQLPAERRDVPLLAVELADGTTLLIDGNHRMVRRWLDGCPTYKVIRAKLGRWEPFLLDIPEKLGRRLLE